MLTVLGGLAEFVIRARTGEGRERAKKDGCSSVARLRCAGSVLQRSRRLLTSGARCSSATFPPMAMDDTAATYRAILRGDRSCRAALE
jgi:hypothetical protein